MRDYMKKFLLLALALTVTNSSFAKVVKEKTFAIIKPDAVQAKNSGKIIDRIEKEGFTILRMQKLLITPEKAATFYAVHKGRPFFNRLVKDMSEAPIIVMVLEKENAIKSWRELMGATNPLDAKDGTIRKLYGKGIDANATHGSDAPETARQEIALFFPELS